MPAEPPLPSVIEVPDLGLLRLTDAESLPAYVPDMPLLMPPWGSQRPRFTVDTEVRFDAPQIKATCRSRWMTLCKTLQPSSPLLHETARQAIQEWTKSDGSTALRAANTWINKTRILDIAISTNTRSKGIVGFFRDVYRYGFSLAVIAADADRYVIEVQFDSKSIHGIIGDHDFWILCDSKCVPASARFDG